jgi:hypothetical protein
VDCIDLAHKKDKWQVLVNAVMNFVFHKMQEIPEQAEEI